MVPDLKQLSEPDLWCSSLKHPLLLRGASERESIQYFVLTSQQGSFSHGYYDQECKAHTS